MSSCANHFYLPKIVATSVNLLWLEFSQQTSVIMCIHCQQSVRKLTDQGGSLKLIHGSLYCNMCNTEANNSEQYKHSVVSRFWDKLGQHILYAYIKPYTCGQQTLQEPTPIGTQVTIFTQDHWYISQSMYQHFSFASLFNLLNLTANLTKCSLNWIDTRKTSFFPYTLPITSLYLRQDSSYIPRGTQCTN